MTVLETSRLRLEPICPAYYDGLRVLDADPLVQRFISGKPETPEETAATKIGWRLRPSRWGRGYAIEAARRMAAFAFDDSHAPLLAAVGNPGNATVSVYEIGAPAYAAMR